MKSSSFSTLAPIKKRNTAIGGMNVDYPTSFAPEPPERALRRSVRRFTSGACKSGVYASNVD